MTRSIRLVVAASSPVPSVDDETKMNAEKHERSLLKVVSDVGSTPTASTNSSFRVNPATSECRRIAPVTGRDSQACSSVRTGTQKVAGRVPIFCGLYLAREICETDCHEYNSDQGTDRPDQPD